MRTERALVLALLLCAALGSGAARAEPEASASSSILSPARFSVALPLEAHVIGAAQGVHPELLWRPFADDGATHVLVSAGFLPGSEYVFVPVNVGVRWVWRPWRFLEPQLGLGVEQQSFFVDDGGPFTRTAFTTELGASVAVDDRFHVGVMGIASLAPFGVPGPGLAGRLTLTWDLGTR